MTRTDALRTVERLQPWAQALDDVNHAINEAHLLGQRPAETLWNRKAHLDIIVRELGRIVLIDRELAADETPDSAKPRLEEQRRELDEIAKKHTEALR